MRARWLISMALLLPIFFSTTAAAEGLLVATWNVEHLNEDNDSGCIPRSDDDYSYIANRLSDLSAHVVAIQEVESASAAYRVFPKKYWQVIMSERPNTRRDDGGAICWGTEDKRLRHQATGIALRRDVTYESHASYAHLAGDNPNQRWGTDVSIFLDDLAIRLLSVHLASGCWGPEQDADSDRANICTTLRGQVSRLVEWIEDRNENQEQFVILGDFNRRLALDGDWAAEQLFADHLNTSLLTQDLRDGVAQKDWCDERYPDLIDHFIVSKPLLDRIVPDSLHEHPRIRENPDHCIISAKFE